MSDSEEEFASADEGEAGMSPKKPEVKQDKIKKTKDKQEANTDQSGEQAKSDKATESDKDKGEQNESKSKKGGGVGDAKKSSSASKPQDSNSTASGKGKQAGKKGKKGGRKGGKEATDMDKPKEAKAADKVESGVSQVSTHKTEHDPKSDIKSEETSGMKEETETTVEKSTEDVTKSVGKSESENANDTQQDIGNLDKSLKGADESKTKPANTEEVKTPTRSTNTTTEKVESEAADLVTSPSTQSIPRPGPDHTQEQENVLSKLAGSAQGKQQSGWGWGWGSSILNVASSSVSTFTSQVGEGFNTMIETVESTLNVPSPEELVKKREDGEESDNSETLEGATASKPIVEQVKSSQNDEQEDKMENSTEAENQSPKDSTNNWFSSWGVGNITKMVESTGKTLVTGSLDALETLGKKTMDALNDHDPGFKKTRGLIKEQGDRPNLSAMLRDARDHHEEQVKLEKESEEARKAHFGTLFDDYQGLAHLEALEILSNQSEKKVNSLLMAVPSEDIASLKPQLLEIKANFEIGDEDEDDVDEHDFSGLVSDMYGELSIGTSPDKLTRAHAKIRDSLKEFGEKTETDEKSTPKEIHQVAIQSLAEFTSKCIEQFHKSGEMILLMKTQNSDFVSSSKLLHSLTKVMCTEIGILSTKFTECLNSNTAGDDSTNMNQLVTSVYLEASNSGSYVQDGFQLLLPVLQQAAIEKNQEPTS